MEMNLIELIGPIMNGTILVGVGLVLRGVSRINGRLTAIETWRNEHVKLDDERHKSHHTEFDAIWKKVSP